MLIIMMIVKSFYVYTILPNLGLNEPPVLWAKSCKYQAQCLNKQNQLAAAQANWRYVELVWHETVRVAVKVRTGKS